MSAAKCEICGEPMPAGEEMFKFHGYSGPCPNPPLPRKKPPAEEVIAGIVVPLLMPRGDAKACNTATIDKFGPTLAATFIRKLREAGWAVVKVAESKERLLAVLNFLQHDESLKDHRLAVMQQQRINECLDLLGKGVNQ